MLAGSLNGIGSLLFYSSLARIDASLAQLLFSFYPIFVALVLYFDGLRYRPVTILRLALSIPAVYLLLQAATARFDLVGILFALGAGILYALHIPINQRVLYEVPAPTVTLYTLLSMTAIVIPAYLLFSPRVASMPSSAWMPLLSLTIATFISRITLFAGVKSIGGLQAALIGLSELFVTVLLSIFWLGESLTWMQWLGAALLFGLLVLAGFEDPGSRQTRVTGWLHWLRPPLPLPATISLRHQNKIFLRAQHLPGSTASPAIHYIAYAILLAERNMQYPAIGERRSSARFLNRGNGSFHSNGES